MVIGFQANPYSLPVFLAGGIFAILAYYSWLNRSTVGAFPFMLFQLCASLWSFAYGIELLSSNMDFILFARTVRYFAVVFIGVTWFFFTLTYTERDEWITPWSVILICIIPVITIVLIATDSAHNLVFTNDRLVTVGSFVYYTRETSTWFLIHAVYEYLLLLAGLSILVSAIINAHIQYKKQVAIIIAGILIGLLGNIAFNLDLYDHPMDISPFPFTITGIAISIALFRYQFLDLRPIARDRVIESMREGVLTVDDSGRIVDSNDRITELLDVDPKTLIGADFRSVIPDVFDDITIELSEITESTVTFESTLQRNGTTKYFDVLITPLREQGMGVIGYIIVLHDITERKTREQELERQKDRLDEFSSVISHDLQNPLSAAELYLDRARNECDFSSLAEVEHAHHRMHAIIEDVLVLARKGKTVDNLEQLDFEDTVTEAWDNSSTKDAELEVTVDFSTIEADRSRLLQVFENLFKNALDHGPNGIDIRVGSLGMEPYGFYVEDTGDGIPEHLRDEIFDHGFTTSDDGTGLGLSIVESVVEAHGWQIRVTEGTEGGARFEITGVRVK